MVLPHKPSSPPEQFTHSALYHLPTTGIMTEPGAQQVTDLIGGQVQFGIDVLTSSLPHIRSGALRGLATLSKTRSDMLPDLPTIGETVAGYEASGWAGLGAPKGTPSEIIERLNGEINAGLENPSIKRRLADVAATPILYTPTEFGAYMAAEVKRHPQFSFATGTAFARRLDYFPAQN
jgi:tripartite-type tricarboxylate transporter receptor subunit TctC